jgi:hypothetical protein
MYPEPLARGMKPVSCRIMLNFLHWLVSTYPDSLPNLQHLPPHTLASLISRFEQERPDIILDKGAGWPRSIEKLFDNSRPQDEYAAARETYRRLL